jgi:hypothetical protein
MVALFVGDTAVVSSALTDNTDGVTGDTAQKVGASMKLAVMPEQHDNTIVLPVAAVLPGVCAVTRAPTAPLPVHPNSFGTLSSIRDAELSGDGCELSKPSVVDELEERYYRLLADMPQAWQDAIFGPGRSSYARFEGMPGSITEGKRRPVNLSTVIVYAVYCQHPHRHPVIVNTPTLHMVA